MQTTVIDLQCRSLILVLILNLLDHSGHDEDGVVVIDFICKCIDQRPQSFIEGDYDVDCGKLFYCLYLTLLVKV